MRTLPQYQFTLSSLFKLITAAAIALGGMHLLGWPSFAEIVLAVVPIAVLVV